MGVDDEFGPDTETIRAWLSKRATYTKDARVIGSPRGGPNAEPAEPAETAGHRPPRLEQVDVGGIDNVALGRSVLEALTDTAEPPSPPAPAQAIPARTSTASAPEVVRGRWTAPPDDLSTRSTDVDFGTRSGVRRVMSLLLLAGLAQVSEDMLEAAKVDGATWLQRLTKVILPNMRAAIMVAVLFRALDAFRIFDNVFIMTNGAFGTEVLSLLAYRTSISRLEIGMGSAVSVLLFICVLLICFIAIKLFKVDLAGARGSK